MNNWLEHIIQSIRHWVLSIWLIWIPGMVWSQLFPVTSTILTNGQATTPYLHQWFDPAQILPPVQIQLLLNDFNEPNVQVRVEVVLSGPGIELQTPANFLLPPILLTPGMHYTLSGAEFQNALQSSLQPGNIPFGSFENNGGRLPEGVYTICATAYDFRRPDEAPVSNQGCGILLVEGLDPPVWLPIQPQASLPDARHNLSIVSQLVDQNLVFSWQSLHSAPIQAQYTLQIYEMVPGLSPEQVMTQLLPMAQITTTNQQYFYSSLDPPLKTGVTYLARLHVRDLLDQFVFKNNGYAVPGYFQIAAGGGDGSGDGCGADGVRPGLIASRAARDQVLLSWEIPLALVQDTVLLWAQSPESEGIWAAELLTGSGRQRLLSTSRMGTYRYRVSARCATAADTVLSDIASISTYQLPDLGPDSCGLAIQIDVDNSIPLPHLFPGDSILAGDFVVVVEEAYGENGYFNGYGYSLMPAFGNYVKVSVSFEQIYLNAAYRLTSGTVASTYLEDGGDILNASWWTDMFAAIGGYDDLDYYPVQIEVLADSIYVNTQGEVVIIDSAGQEAVIHAGGSGGTTGGGLENGPGVDQPVSITDGNGQETVVIGESIGTVGNTNITTENAYTLNGLDLGRVDFQASPEQRCGMDLPRNVAPEGQYEQMGNYAVGWKAIPLGQSDPVLALASGNIPQKDLLFETTLGMQLQYPVSSASIRLPVPGRSTSQTDAVMALIPDPQDSGKYLSVGKLNLATYEIDRYKLQLVPINGATVGHTAEQVAEALNSIYHQAVVEWEVEILPSVTIENYDLNGNGALDAGKAGIGVYDPELKLVGQALKEVVDPGTKDLPVFVIAVVDNLSANYTGYMPRGRNLGFVQSGTSNLVRLIAHELGHGAFSLQHSWETYPNLLQSTTDNLMDYGDGTFLFKDQWDQIHSNKVVLGFWETEEGAGRIVQEEAFYQEQYVFFRPDEDIAYSTITPSNEYYSLPKGALAGFLNRDVQGWSKGSLSVFEINGVKYFGFWNTKTKSFKGYAEGKVDTEGRPNRTGDYIPSLQNKGPFFIGWQETCEINVYQKEDHEIDLFADSAKILSIPIDETWEIYNTEKGQNTVCGCIISECSDLLIVYEQHPYLREKGIFRDVICGNPCALKGLEHYRFFDPAQSLWMEQVKNIFAGLTAFGFLPAVGTIASQTVEPVLEVIISSLAELTATEIVSRYAVGYHLDKLIQTAINYYFPEEGGDISWEEAKSRIEYAASHMAGMESLILLESKYGEALVSGAFGCFVDGAIMNGNIKESFNFRDCAGGAISAVLMHSVLNISSTAIAHLRKIPPGQVYAGISKIMGNPHPNVAAAGIQLGDADIWRFWKVLKPGALATEDVKVLFNIEDDLIATKTTQLLNDNTTLIDELLESGLFVRIRQADFSPEIRATFLDDLLESEELRRAMGDNWDLVRGWERFIDAPKNIRNNIYLLEDVVKIDKPWPKGWNLILIGDAVEVYNTTGRKLATIFEDRIVAPGRAIIGETGNSILNRSPLIKSMKYDVDDFIYETDGLGRVFRTSGDLDDLVRIRLGNQQIKAVDVKDGVRGTDQGGHIIGARFFGPGEQVNYYPQSANLNQGAWKQMENTWASEMVNGKDVKVEVRAIFESISNRPIFFEVDYWVDGIKKAEFFEND